MMIVTAMMLVLLVGFSLYLSAEIRNPILATPREAEHVAGAPVAAVARDGDRALRIGGIDPFRMLYLSLTAFFLFLTLRVVESRRWK